MALPYGAPTGCTVCEYSATVREEQRRRGRIFISIDVRDSLVPGLHFRGDFRLVLHLFHWPDGVFCFTPCTHMLRRDDYLAVKMQDGRALHCLFLFVYAFCADGGCISLEQPDTIVSDYLVPYSSDFRACDAGDPWTKRFQVYLRGTSKATLEIDPSWRVDGRRRGGSNFRRQFKDADARDLFRSSWEDFPHTATLIVSQVRPGESTLCPLNYQWVAETVLSMGSGYGPPEHQERARASSRTPRVAVNVFGLGFLAPRRKEPFTMDMLRAVCANPEWHTRRCAHVACRVAHQSRSSSQRQLMCFLLRTGFRLAEVAAHSSGEIKYLTRSNLTAVVSPSSIEAITPEVLRENVLRENARKWAMTG